MERDPLTGVIELTPEEHNATGFLLPQIFPDCERKALVSVIDLMMRTKSDSRLAVLSELALQLSVVVEQLPEETQYDFAPRPGLNYVDF